MIGCRRVEGRKEDDSADELVLQRRCCLSLLLLLPLPSSRGISALSSSPDIPAANEELNEYAHS